MDGGQVGDALCVEVPHAAGEITVEIETEAELVVADLLFLIDVSDSMSSELEAITLGLRERMVPGFAEEISDVAFGLATFSDFPIEPYGRSGDSPFSLLVEVTRDASAVEDALREVGTSIGGDEPESQAEALYRVATAEEVGFRPEALPVVLLFTDAPFHDGPSGLHAYDGLSPAPATWQQAVDALRGVGAHAVGLDSSEGGGAETAADLRATASALGTVDLGGAPLVFESGDEVAALSSTVVDAVVTLAQEVRLDVDALVEDVPGDAYDGRDFVLAIRPLSASPADAVRAIDGVAFRGVVPGTRLTFALVLASSIVEPTDTPVTVPLRIIVRGSFRTVLAVVRVDLVLPGADGTGCPAPGGRGD